MAYLQQAGKTAPRLAEDIQLYDSTYPPSTGRNLLAHVPPVYPEDYNGPLEYISGDACLHNYVKKPDQTHLAQADQPRRQMSKVSAICSKCRRHLQVVVTYNNGMVASGNGLADHVHHFVYKSGRQRGRWTTEEVMETGQTAETFHYQCLHYSCSTVVSLRIISPIFDWKFTQLLTDPDVIRERAKAAFASQPERLEGVAAPLPITVLDNLRLYLTNALRHGDRSKPITQGNKRFMVSFGVKGEPCRELLEFLGFSCTENDAAWKPPLVDRKASLPYQDAFCIFLDDAILELVCLINQRPASERRGIQLTALPPSAKDDIFYALEASDYPRSKRANEFEMAPAPFYEDLGTVEDMSASLIVDSYHHQVQGDPPRAPHYLNCLKSIGTIRGGEDWEIINQAVQLAYSEGRYTNEDVTDAYKYFGLQRNDRNLTQDAIVSKFYAVLGSTNQETEVRRQMWNIGQDLGSERIKAASQDRVATAEQARVFLGVDENTPDDFIITMYTAKVNDNPSCKELADKAVQLIAESRNSHGLDQFIKTGETVAGEMDIADAYRMLQIPEGTADDGSIMAAYTICVDENPRQVELYGQALRIIANEIDSIMLKSMAGITAETERDLTEWPVGLQNIGNTCYLNSLLQFYFSIKPYRDLVLNIEKYQMDTANEASMSGKKVGSRMVSGKEIERSLRFLTELRVLFRDMIFSQHSSVTPSQELALLTLISPGNEAAIRRRSTITKSQIHGLGDINGAPVSGPLGPPQPLFEYVPGHNATPSIASDTVELSDTGSEATLVSEDNGTGATIEMGEVGDVAPEAAWITENNGVGAHAPSMGSDPISEGYVNISPTQPEPPARPPPIPPRPAAEIDTEKQLIEELEIGAQQDVTEVINNVLFQSQCAIKPREVASDGEQVDHVKDMFYGQTRSYITSSGGTRFKDERWCDIKVDVALGPRDIYDAIDGAFDVQSISVENAEAEQYGSITRIPPVLQIQVQRVQFDPVKKTSYKSTNHLQLVERIYMDRYMDTSRTDLLERRRQCWEWKKSLASIETRRAELLRKQEKDGLGMVSLFQSAYGGLDDLDSIDGDTAQEDSAMLEADESNSGLDNPKINEQLAQELKQMSEDVVAEFNSLNQQIEDTKLLIARNFAQFQDIPYDLYAVFVHRGSVSFGHYWIYIKDFQKNIWRKYNDEYVTEVQDLNEIFGNKNDANPPTPYFLVYIHGSKKDLLVSPVCREVVEDNVVDVNVFDDNVVEDAKSDSPADDPSIMEGIISPNPIEHAHQDFQQSPFVRAKDKELEDTDMADQ
ncbi:Peptidase C19 ubiquitin carboxyl-terminal hydrolase 2 [Penicillium verhagenii]|nr:Peptidase C19 ubiquitin carboxyl-terminal hydrolase 2 [Penicillium verhagenii]